MAPALARQFASASPPASSTEIPWSPVQWCGHTAWQSSFGPWSAIVSLDTCRLTYFGPRSGDWNFLHPAPQVLHVPRSAEDAQSWGGHLFWLGPQCEWPADWPPSRATDYSSASDWSLRRGDTRLELEHPPDHVHPGPVRRAYEWVKGRLRCEASWIDPEGHHQGIHVFQIRSPEEIHLACLRSPHLPHGYARWQPGHPYDRSHHLDDWVEERGLLIKQFHSHPQKWAFPAQPVTARYPEGGSLTIHPCDFHALTLDWPDAELMTQIWTGGPGWPWWELEQSTPRLRSRPGSPIRTTVELEPYFPSA